MAAFSFKGLRMHLHYWSLIFVLFGGIILIFRNYFLKGYIRSQGEYGLQQNVQAQNFWNKLFKKDVAESKIFSDYEKVQKILILLTGIGFIVVGLLTLVGIMPP